MIGSAVEISETDLHSETLFAEVLLPVPVPAFFTYRVPATMAVLAAKGRRVIVQFGDRKVMTGIIASVHRDPPREYQAKYLLEILDDRAVLSEVQLRFFQWVSSYYLCTLGEVLNAALPSGLKLSSESRVQLNPSFDPEEKPALLSDKEYLLLTHLKTAESLTYTEIINLLGVKNVYYILKSLVAKEAVILFEEVKEKYKPKTEKRIRLVRQYCSPAALESLFTEIASKPKQEEILLRYLQLVPVLADALSNDDGVRKKVMMNDDLSVSSFNTLVKKGVLEEFEVIVPRFDTDDDFSGSDQIQLSEEQTLAYGQILELLPKHPAVLLHGITGSGKTEIYIQLIRQALDAGSQVLYLLPEIALTTQIVQRLKRIFGGSIGVYHSRFSDNERVEVWNGVLKGTYRFVVGVRSSVFLPFDNLGLIIVDEEHETSYKQQEPAPRYHARDAAIMLGQLHYAKVLLGSATPSVETFYNAQQGRYGYVGLSRRYGEASLPKIQIADLGRERRQKTIKGEFSSLLMSQITETISKKEQVIIFQNRRGYSPVMTCEDCGWVPRCVNCSVSLTYYQYKHLLICHYCGYRTQLPQNCESCTSTRLKTVGYGTEKLEEELNLHFPDARIQRMDLDTTRSRTGYESILDHFEKGETNILVGTQMVTKGLDFDGVSLVGIFNADRMIHFPDFRSYERAYQLITQVSGRAGRRATQGTVVIQTSDPKNPLLQLILQNNTSGFYSSQLADRQRHNYPPFSRLIEITVKHMDKKVTISTAGVLAGQLRETLGGITVLGPAEPVISKIRNLYLMTILIKIPRGKADLALVKEKIAALTSYLLREKEHRSSRIIIDVDPV